MRTADSIEENKSQKPAQSSGQSRTARVERLKPYRFQPGQSGNPGGRKHDEAREIARKIFENNPEEIYKALGKSLLAGNAYVFKELAEHGYGKLKESVSHDFGQEMQAVIEKAFKRG